MPAPEPQPLRRFIWTTAIAIEAATLEAALVMVEDVWPDDGAWFPVTPCVEVYSPGGDPDEVEDVDPGPECICPPDLVARGGFRGGCPVHN